MIDIQYLGNELIERDLKRLKKYKSLQKDIKDSFKIWKKVFYKYCATTDDRVFHDETMNGYEAKIGISSHNLNRQKGARLWYAIMKDENTIYYLPIALFDCREEKQPKFKKTPLLKKFKERLLEFREFSYNCPNNLKTK